jgi:hypothetical protein
MMVVVFYGQYENDYPKIYEDMLAMISLFLLLIMSFIRSVLDEIKPTND